MNPATYNATFMEDFPLKDAGGKCVFGHIINDLDAKTFFSPATTNPTANVVDWLSAGWGAITIEVDGGPVSSNLLDMELFINFELRFDEADTMNQVATMSAPVNTTLSEIASRTRAAVPNVLRSKEVENAFMGVAKRLVSFGAGAVTGYLTKNPAAASGAMQITSHILEVD